MEHLLAVSRNGGNEDDNCVVCCKTVNQYLGNLTLKQKLQVILNQRGEFRCPAEITPVSHTPQTTQIIQPDQADGVHAHFNVALAHLKSMGKAKPKTLKTLTNRLRSSNIPEGAVPMLLEQLQHEGVIQVQANQVSYRQF